MAIIVFGGVKGGTAKTTSAVNCAVMCAAEGRSVLLVDADENECANIWGMNRQEADLAPVVRYEIMRGKGIHRQLLDRQREFDHVIVDCGGHDSAEFRIALQTADQLIIPLRPNQTDVDTLLRLIDIIKQYAGEHTRLRVLMTQLRPFSEEAKRAFMAPVLAPYPDIELMDTVTTIRSTYELCQGNGTAVVEFAASREVALKEMQQMHKEIWS